MPDTTYDLVDYGFNWYDLSRDGKKTDCRLMIEADKTFKWLGENGFLRGKALQLFKKIS
jgi:hypothetical protein